jgi:pilus assembly protein CpaF
VTIRDLLKATLRHRPDRIILGEIRGGEAFDLLQLLNMGHSGTISTVHANSAAQGISRFTTCVLQSGIEIPYLAVKTNIADSLNVIVQIERRPGDSLCNRGFRNQRLRYGEPGISGLSILERIV